jgi:peptidoglycan hydrolase CwlO-like protein
VSDENVTKPTMNTILERIDDLRSHFDTEIGSIRTDIRSIRTDIASIHSQMGSLALRVDGVESSLKSEIDSLRTETKIGFDRVRSEVKLLHSHILDMRADITEVKSHVKEPA